MRLEARGHTCDFSTGPFVMGIVNLSADSFSGDGCGELDAAFAKTLNLMTDGAQMIDVGAESARTNRQAIGEQEEIDRLCGFVEKWTRAVGDGQINTPAPVLAINTWRPAVARCVLREGGDMLNDIGGLPTDENARICAEVGAALVIMHTVGQPKVPHTHVKYEDILSRLEEFFAEKLAIAERAGLRRDSIVLDPGIDFAKQRDDNLLIYRELVRLERFNQPILLPVSRKTVIGDVLGLPPHERDAGTIACSVAGILRGAHILRVHNVRAAVQAVRVVWAVQNATAGQRTS